MFLKGRDEDLRRILNGEGSPVVLGGWVSGSTLPHDGQASNKGHRLPFRDDDCGHGL